MEHSFFEAQGDRQDRGGLGGSQEARQVSRCRCSPRGICSSPRPHGYRLHHDCIPHSDAHHGPGRRRQNRPVPRPWSRRSFAAIPPGALVSHRLATEEATTEAAVLLKSTATVVSAGDQRLVLEAAADPRMVAGVLVGQLSAAKRFAEIKDEQADRERRAGLGSEVHGRPAGRDHAGGAGAASLAATRAHRYAGRRGFGALPPLRFALGRPLRHREAR